LTALRTARIVPGRAGTVYVDPSQGLAAGGRIVICESCQQNLATVHLTEIVQKYKKETHLCEACAKSRGVPFKPQFSVKEFLGNLSQPEAAPAAPKAAPPPAEQPDPCPACGLTFAEFKAAGRFGCWRDYEHFRKGVVPLLEKIHGATQHRGHVPARLGQRLEREKLLAGYQRELAQAIEREDYERAALLRDKIKALEPAPGKGPG
jgi:protein arginine kinase activator